MKTSSCVLTIIFESGERFEFPRTAHIIPDKDSEKEFLDNNYPWFRDYLDTAKGKIIEEIEFFYPPDIFHKHKFNKHIYRLSKEIMFF